MSFTVLVVPEDHTLDQYILLPLVRKLMAACGRPRATVNVLRKQRVQGYSDAKKVLVEYVLPTHKYYNLLLFMPDADGRDRADEFRHLESEAALRNVRLLCCAAVEEVEAWLLAGHLGKLNNPWSVIRADTSVKENHFFRFLQSHGDVRAVDGGRKRLMEETLLNYSGLLDRCPELKELESRLAAICGPSRS